MKNKYIIVMIVAIIMIAIALAIYAVYNEVKDNNEEVKNTSINKEEVKNIISNNINDEEEKSMYSMGKHHAEVVVKNYGTISLELDADVAPITVDNFAKLVNEGFYDGLTFHRIISGFMIQGGDP